MSEYQDLGRLLACCGHLGRQYGENLLRQRGYDVTPVQTRMLVYLSCCRDEVNQRDLERELRLRPSTVNGIVSRLEEKGCITRRASPTDGRCRLVGLTGAGQARVDAFQAVMADTGRRYASFLTEEEEAALRDMLSRMIEKLENEVNTL